MRCHNWQEQHDVKWLAGVLARLIRQWILATQQSA